MKKSKVNKNHVMDGIIILQLILVLVIGWQVYNLDKKMGSSQLAVASDSTANTATANTQNAANDSAAKNVNFNYKVTNTDHVKGASDAKVTIVEFSDFECPYCGRALGTINEILSTYKDDVQLVYKHFPLKSIHRNAQKAGEASECAAKQGKFWEMHDKIFENQTQLSVSNLKSMAKGLGLNSSQFDSCLDSGEMANIVSSDQTLGSQNGVTGTPGFFVNNKFLSGAYPFATFKQIIDAELSK